MKPIFLVLSALLLTACQSGPNPFMAPPLYELNNFEAKEQTAVQHADGTITIRDMD